LCVCDFWLKIQRVRNENDEEIEEKTSKEIKMKIFLLVSWDWLE